MPFPTYMVYGVSVLQGSVFFFFFTLWVFVPMGVVAVAYDGYGSISLFCLVDIDYTHSCLLYLLNLETFKICSFGFKPVK